MWFERLELEHDNMRAALSWAIKRGEGELGLRLAGVVRFWWAQGYFDEGRRRLEEVLAKGDGATTRIKALDGVAGWRTNRVIWIGQRRPPKRAQADVEAGIEGSAAAFTGPLGDVMHQRGDTERAKELSRKGKTLPEGRGQVGVASILGGLGNSSTTAEITSGRRNSTRKVLPCPGLGASRTAQRLSDQPGTRVLAGGRLRTSNRAKRGSRDAAPGAGGGWSRVCLRQPCWAALLRGDDEQAETLHKESLELCRELGDRYIGSESLEGLACSAGLKKRGRAGGQAVRRSAGAARGGRLPASAQRARTARAVPGGCSRLYRGDGGGGMGGGT